MGLLPPDIVSYQLPNWELNTACFCAAAWRKSAGTPDLVGESVPWRGTLGLWNQRCETSFPGQDAVRQQFLLSFLQVD